MGQKSTYSREIIVFCKFNECEFVKKLGMILENKVSKIEAIKNFNTKVLGSDEHHMLFSNFSCLFLNPNIFFQFEF